MSCDSWQADRTPSVDSHFAVRRCILALTTDAAVAPFSDVYCAVCEVAAAKPLLNTSRIVVAAHFGDARLKVPLRHSNLFMGFP